MHYLVYLEIQIQDIFNSKGVLPLLITLLLFSKKQHIKFQFDQKWLTKSHYVEMLPLSNYHYYYYYYYYCYHYNCCYHCCCHYLCRYRYHYRYRYHCHYHHHHHHHHHHSCHEGLGTGDQGYPPATRKVIPGKSLAV